MSKIASVTKSEHVKVDYHTVSYTWCYDMFHELEKYVDFCNDRQYWYDQGESYERKRQEQNNQ